MQDADVLAGAEAGVGQHLADLVVAGDQPALVAVREDQRADRAGLAQAADPAGRVERTGVALGGQALRNGKPGGSSEVPLVTIAVTTVAGSTDTERSRA
ncbi:hypothetical protein GCM10018954_037410 [Kutzneria kofuensis]